MAAPCNGQDNNSAIQIKDTRAFCEGLTARTASNAASNPHESGSETADSWDRGAALATAQAGTGPVDPADAPCCAVSGATPPA